MKQARAKQQVQTQTENPILGKCLELRQTLTRARKVARSKASALILGPTGCGKEGLAQLLHRESGRSGAFVPVNCAALPLGLAESELFGYTRGAFTGASGDRAGLLEKADGGTLFLDEVGELPREVQAKLLRTLQEGTLRPVGASSERPVDVRVVAATSRDLNLLRSAGDFGDDLYYRLAGVVLRLPPLKDRGADILILARHFLKLGEGGEPGAAKSPTLSRPAADLLMRYTWPGNVRELRGIMMEVRLTRGEGSILPHHILPLMDGFSPPTSPLTHEETIFAALQAKGEVTTQELAHLTGLSRTSLLRLLHELGHRGQVHREGTARACRYRPGPSRSANSLSSTASEVATMPILPNVPRHLTRLLEFFRGRVHASRQDVAIALDLPDRTTTRSLAQLVEMGQVEMIGKRGRGVRYQLVKTRSEGPISSNPTRIWVKPQVHSVVS